MIKLNLSKTALIDFIFVMLPFFVFLIVNSISGEHAMVKTFYSSEVGFAASILYGQLVAKFVIEVADSRGVVKADSAGLVVTVLVSLLLVTSIVLAIVLIFKPIPEWLYWVQLMFFIVAIYLHFDFYEKLELFKSAKKDRGSSVSHPSPSVAE